MLSYVLACDHRDATQSTAFRWKTTAERHVSAPTWALKHRQVPWSNFVKASEDKTTNFDELSFDWRKLKVSFCSFTTP